MYVRLVTQSYPTLCNPLDCIPPGFSVHGIFQARILEWVAISCSKSLPDPGTEPLSPVSPALQADSGALTLPQKEKIRLKTRNLNSNLVQSIISHMTSENLLPLWSAFVCFEGVGVFLFSELYS